MEKAGKVKYTRTLAWLMAAVLTVTTITPAFTSFAADEYETAADSADEGKGSDVTESSTDTDKKEDSAEKTDHQDDQDKSDGNEDSGQDNKEDSEEDSTQDTKEDPIEDCGEDTKEDTAESDDNGDEDDLKETSSDLKEDIKEDIRANISKYKKEDDESLDTKDIELENDIGILPRATESNASRNVFIYEGEYYETIQEILDIIKDGEGKITLTDDAKLSEIIEIKEGTIVFDLDGYTLSGEIYVENGSAVTVENGTIDSGDKYWKVHASGDDSKPTKFTLAEDAKITARTYGLLICGKGGASGNNGAGFIVTIDGNIEVGDDILDNGGGGIWLQGNMKTETARVCDVIINGSVINADADGPGIAVNGWGNVFINEDAEVAGETGVEIRAGSLTVNGGVIRGKTDAFVSWSNSKGSSTCGAGIAINEHTTKLPITITVKDGEITGHYALAQVNTQEVPNKVNLSVTGGTFIGYNIDCALLLSEYESFKDHFSITGGTFIDSDGNKSDVSAYFTADYIQNETGGITTEEPAIPSGGEGESGDNDDINIDSGNGSVDNESSGSHESNGGHSGAHSGSHSGGSGRSSSSRPTGLSQDSSYIGANGMKGSWYLSRSRFNEAEGTWDLSGWWFKYSDGSYPHNDWAQLTHNGRSDWYYFDPEGWMVTGWKQIDGYWYYLGDDGTMLHDTQTPDGHTVDSSGRAVS